MGLGKKSHNISINNTIEFVKASKKKYQALLHLAGCSRHSGLEFEDQAHANFPPGKPVTGPGHLLSPGRERTAHGFDDTWWVPVPSQTLFNSPEEQQNPLGTVSPGGWREKPVNPHLKHRDDGCGLLNLDRGVGAASRKLPQAWSF